MARLVVVVVFILMCSACAKDHNKPIASLSYGEIVARPGVGLYDLGFKSDVDLLNLFKSGEGFVGGILYCALGDDADFSVGHVMQMSGYGSIRPDARVNSYDGYAFIATLSFKETFDEGRSSRMLSADEVRVLLADRGLMPCQYVATIFNYKPYYSGVLKVPVGDVLREVGR